MYDFLNSNKLLTDSICEDNVAGVKTALNMGAKLTGAALLDDNLYDVECAVLNLPLNQAFKYRASNEIITLLKQAGATCEIPNIYRCSALYFASADGSCSLAQKLIQEGSKIDARNLFGETPLHIAVRFGHEKMVKLLCEKGANIFLSDRNGRTPLKLIDLMKKPDLYRQRKIEGKQIDVIHQTLINSQQMQQVRPCKIATQKPKVSLNIQNQRIS